MSAFGPVFPTPELSVISPYRGLAFVNAQPVIDTIRRTLRMIYCSFRLKPAILLPKQNFVYRLTDSDDYFAATYAKKAFAGKIRLLSHNTFLTGNCESLCFMEIA